MRDPSRYPLQLPWLARTEAARERVDHELLVALVDDRLWTPDFLNPRPLSPLTRFEDELDTLAPIAPDELPRAAARGARGRCPPSSPGRTSGR